MPIVSCQQVGCESSVHTKGFCKSHYDKARYQSKREEILIKTKIYSEANKDKIKARGEVWRASNKRHTSEKNRRNYLARKEHYDQSRRKWRENNRLKWNSYSSIRRVRVKENGVFLILPKEYRKLSNQNCFYCGSKDSLTIDHVIPIARGGRHSIGNIVIACKPCNSQKNKRTIQEWRQLRCV
jgi:5-methylcytosine-specific restriction endonuclease McrA